MPDQTLTPEMQKLVEEAHAHEHAYAPRACGVPPDCKLARSLTDLVRCAQEAERARVWEKAIATAEKADPGPVYLMPGATVMNAFEYVVYRLRAAKAEDR